MAIGIQGLADMLMMLKIPYESNEAKEINKQIFETLYHAALTSSVELSKLHGPYSSFEGSPASQGILQYDMWGVTPSNMYDWNILKDCIK
jgi:ribonucleoside-diphosphate reductase subunit M1